ncbi:nucleotidyltransferase domain-containing protein [Actinokineospora sp.]|uniref:nucleotidyltransferase domain-containing protein n=1 Tax=Actinokineospora sp. TaxID=1872133 RepID=UPI004037CB63
MSTLVTEHTVLSAVVGSHAYGLATEESDVDRRGVYVAPTAWFWRFAKPPSSMEGPEPEQLSWEVEHFCALALKANPSVLDLLVSEHVEVCTPIGAELRALLPAFLSRRAAVSFERATARQITRATSAPEPKWKQVMHSIRMLTVCRTLLTTGTLDIHRTDERDALLAVRSGEVALADCMAWIERLRAEIARAAEHGPLPETPDLDRVQDWLISVRRRGLDADHGA